MSTRLTLISLISSIPPARLLASSESDIWRRGCDSFCFEEGAVVGGGWSDIFADRIELARLTPDRDRNDLRLSSDNLVPTLLAEKNRQWIIINYSWTGEPGDALVNNRLIFSGNGNTFIDSEISKLLHTSTSRHLKDTSLSVSLWGR